MPNTPIVLLSHGKDSSPKSSKLQQLAALAQQYGAETHLLDYTHTKDPELRVQHLCDHIAQQEKRPLVLVGSSMGAYVSTVVAQDQPVLGLFLMAPAFYLEGYAQQGFAPQSGHTVLVHGWQDAVVPPAHSLRFAEAHPSILHLVHDNHRLQHSYGLLNAWFGLFLEAVGLARKD